MPEPSKGSWINIKDGIVTDIKNPPYDGITKSKSFYSADGKIEQNNNVQTATQEEAEAINPKTSLENYPDARQMANFRQQYIDDQISKNIPNTNCVDIKEDNFYDKMVEDLKEEYNRQFENYILAGTPSKDYKIPLSGLPKYNTNDTL
jgi:hypothetical protein